MAEDLDAAPADFRAALLSLRGAPTHRDVRLAEVPAPGRIAPYAAAVSGELDVHGLEASGRFVVLHDPDGQPAWEGTMRIIALVKAVVEPEVGRDELWGEVAWSWLSDALAGVPHRARGGTVTKVTSTSFGELAERPDEVTVELRASWTPTTTDLAPHIAAWTDLMAACAGIPPTPEGVRPLPGRTA
ncbi:DUF3000 domain-containing protein [Demequina sp. SYSU T00039]|uniref:DUF3000 domain-containing protein n=1 Tax=Demequina lignilytica TaxID=3051663 RepID=A0AAW7M7U4_9MICO|nr:MULTISPECIES: DUF3000 domain-containing protein [unclassified Demequina]MDN4486772.1 DUF3000 domain-containing protein [Demequina sp. SYSU T00039]MDN4489456.1 DUF3000 domain-containing protein [Demequina sp. SYSU T00068]